MSGHEHSLGPTVLRIAPRRTGRSSWNALTEGLRYLVMRMSSCWHRRMSRPFTHDGVTYRVCLHCGMRRNFDLEAWKTKGRYHNEIRVMRSVGVPVARASQSNREWKFKVHTA